MKKLIITLSIIVVLVLVGIRYYIFNSPFSLDSVKIPNIGGFSLESKTTMSNFEITGDVEGPLESCYYYSFKPNPSSEHVYACKSKGTVADAFKYWINDLTNFYESTGNPSIKYKLENLKINGIVVSAVVLDDENCGSKGYCTTYYWKQGRIIFSSNTRVLVEQYINAN